MTASRDSTAYQRYDECYMPVPKPETEIKRELREAPRKRSGKRRSLRPAVTASFAAVVLTVFYILVCQMQLTQLTAEVTSQTERLEELTAESVSLSSQKTYNLNMDEIEEYAVQNLGMVKMDTAQIEYVELVNPDTVTVKDSGVSLDTLFSGLIRSISAAVEYIR